MHYKQVQSTIECTLYKNKHAKYISIFNAQ